MLIEVLSLFPSYIEGPLQESILRRAIQKGLLTVKTVDIRHFSSRKDLRVDDRPCGGGPGMVMMAEPVVAAVRSRRAPESRVVYVSPQGQKITPEIAKRLATVPHLILVCGHYEGIDQRAIDSDVDEEVSIGDYVLTNGCLAALVIIDVVARFIPGVLGHEDAASEDSFEHGLFDHPHYTKPNVFEGKSVPDVLLSGDHEKISSWRKTQAFLRTRERRPELVASSLCVAASPSESAVCLEQIVEPTCRFEETCRFYEKVLGCVPEKDENVPKVTFSLGSHSLTFVQAVESVSFQFSLLSFRLRETQFEEAVKWYRRKEIQPLSFEESEKGKTVLLQDPDGRIVRLTNY
jgi:tRNA (guanine37-N1)-methyltransferase